MKTKVNEKRLQMTLKIATFIMSISFLILAIQSCVYNDSFASQSAVNETLEADFNGEICDGKKILRFNTLQDLQQEHLNLYQHYVASNEDEQTLIDYENNHNFYSLRKKENDIDDGIIPDDPTFDELAYTFDPILETLLNEDGMIIIGERLYIWDSGCVIQSIPYSCENYNVLLHFKVASLNNNVTQMHELFYDYKMQNINTCDDPQFDFETISENGGRVDVRDVPQAKNKNGCGYSVVVNKELIGCDNGRNIFKISFESIEPLGSSNPLNLFYLTAAFGDINDLEFALQNIPGQFAGIPLDFEDENYGYLLPFAGTFYMSAPQTMGMQIDITLVSTINLLTGNSCAASDSININLTCPLSIVAEKIYFNSSTAKWSFTFPIGASCGNSVQKITWDFGDGTPPVTAGPSIMHEFNQPCNYTEFTVTASVTGTICGTDYFGDSAISYYFKVPAGNSCNRTSYKFPTYKTSVDGKKMKLSARIKYRNGKSIFKNIFKWRKPGDKTIKSIGTVYSPTANNGSCVQVDISTLVPPKTTNGKKRNKQKVKVYSINNINANDPYKVQFTHSSGFSYTLMATNLYCSQ